MRRGFALLEVLLALFLLGVFLLALLAFTQGTLRTNQRAEAQARLLEELKDAAGYLADTLQEASGVVPQATLDGASCALPQCLVVLFPAPGGGCSPRAYLVMPRRSLPQPFRTRDPWADERTLALMEYRPSYPAGAGCTGPYTSQPEGRYLVLDLLDATLTQPLAVGSTRPLRFDLTLRLVLAPGGDPLYVPGPGRAYSLSVYARNAPR